MPYGVEKKVKMDKLRADRQSTMEQIGIHLGNTLPNMATMIIGDVGRLGTLVFEWGNDRDYKNWLTEWADRNRDAFSQLTGKQVYRKNPEKVLDFSDPAFYLDTAFQIYESVGAFALEGMATAGVLNPLATKAATALTGVADAMRASKAANTLVKGVTLAREAEEAGLGVKALDYLSKGLQKTIPQTANSALLGYFESAQQAKDTYNQIYSELGKKHPVS